MAVIAAQQPRGGVLEQVKGFGKARGQVESPLERFIRELQSIQRDGKQLYTAIRVLDMRPFPWLDLSRPRYSVEFGCVKVCLHGCVCVVPVSAPVSASVFVSVPVYRMYSCFPCSRYFALAFVAYTVKADRLHHLLGRGVGGGVRLEGRVFDAN